VKLSARDIHPEAQTFETRLEGLSDREKRFEDFVGELHYFPEFEKPKEANAAILSLYAELSTYVHAAVPQFESALNRYARGEDAGMESVATLNRFNKLAFQVFDLVLVHVFQSIGLSMAGDCCGDVRRHAQMAFPQRQVYLAALKVRRLQGRTKGAARRMNPGVHAQLCNLICRARNNRAMWPAFRVNRVLFCNVRLVINV
jgi:hypothetical protein